MPIEIKELHIRVAVNVSQGEQSARVNTALLNSNEANSGEIDKDTIVAECVEQVLEVLQNKKER